MPFSRFLCALLTGTLLTASTLSFAAPAHIALLLPQSGRMAKAAETIRDGFLAAYYQDRQAASTVTLSFYDSDSDDTLALIQQARDNGAELIVGPLDRERVAELLQVGSLGIPILALNSTEGSASDIFQFALSPDDEIRRLVAWMVSQGVKRPLILLNADSGSQRLQQLFLAAWKQHFPEQSLTSAKLDPNHAKGLVGSIRGTLKAHTQYDALFLATPALATQLLPTLRYDNQTVAVYSLASAWTPHDGGINQIDLEGLRFCDIPWMVDQPRPEQDMLYLSFPRPNSSFDRLYAFGADAWTLARHWDALNDGEPFALRSGYIQAVANRLVRTPTCAEARNGTATPLWTPDNALPGSASGERRPILP